MCCHKLFASEFVIFIDFTDKSPTVNILLTCRFVGSSIQFPCFWVSSHVDIFCIITGADLISANIYGYTRLKSDDTLVSTASKSVHVPLGGCITVKKEVWSLTVVITGIATIAKYSVYNLFILLCYALF